MSSSNGNQNNVNNSIVYRSRLFRNSEQPTKKASAAAVPVYKMFCKVCQDAKRSESEYTNHNVRDKSGKTVCPTLLAQECRNCYKHGHTVKYCPALKSAAIQQQPQRQQRQQPEAKKATSTQQKNIFLILGNESDEEVEEKKTWCQPVAPAIVRLSVQKPTLNYGRIIEQANNPENYAKAKAEELQLKMAAAEKKRIAEQKAEEIAWAIAEAKSNAEREARESRLKMNRNQAKISWATAESDSEGEDEGEEDIFVTATVVDNSAW